MFHNGNPSFKMCDGLSLCFVAALRRILWAGTYQTLQFLLSKRPVRQTTTRFQEKNMGLIQIPFSVAFVKDTDPTCLR